MAIKDCIRKMKGLVTKDDKALLEQYLADGLTDDQAVRKLLLETDAEILSITKQAAEAGATVANRPDFLGEITSLQNKRVEKIREERVKIADEGRELNETYSDSKVVIDVVRTYWNTLPENKVDGGVPRGIDIMDDQDLNKVLSSMLFNPSMRSNLQKGTFGLKGKAPLELLASFKILRDNQGDIRERLRELAVLDAQAVTRLEEMGTREGEAETFFQGRDVSDIGLRSGLLSAIRIMPQEKGSASQMIAYLKKQPGVKKEELEWIDFEAWLMALGGGPKNARDAFKQRPVTRDEMIAYVEQNGVQIKEVQYGGEPIRTPNVTFDVNSNMTIDHPDNEFDRANMTVYDAIADDRSADRSKPDRYYTVYVDHAAEQVSVTPDEGKTWLTVYDNRALPLENARLAIITHSEEQQRKESGFEQRAEYEGSYQLDGGTNYREVFQTLPDLLEGRTSAGDLVQDITRRVKSLPADKQYEMEQFYVEQLKAMGGYTGRKYFLSAMRDDLVKPEHLVQLGLGGSIIEEKFAELQMTRELIANRFTSHTFNDVKNILAWFRIKDRIGPNGERVLFVEEIQSDWHSAGRESGYSQPGDLTKLKAKVAELEAKEMELWNAAVPPMARIAETGTEGGNRADNSAMERARNRVQTVIRGRSDWMEYLTAGANTNLMELIGDEGILAINAWRLKSLERDHAAEARDNAARGTPDAPFKGNAWAELSMKRLIRMAAEGGYDSIQWTTGKQQSERYGLRQVIDEITWSDAGDGGRTVELHREYENSYIVTVNSDGIIEEIDIEAPNEWQLQPLESVIGQDAAAKIMGDMPVFASLTGADLDVGGDGMRNFYDKVLVNVANKVARKLDKKAKVKPFGGEVILYKGAEYDVEFRDNGWWIVRPDRHNNDKPVYYGPYDGPEQANTIARQGNRRSPRKVETVHQLDISADMKAGAMEGQTLFQREKGSITFDEMRRGLIRLSESRDLSTFLHEAGHLYLETMRSLAEGPGAPQQIKDDWQNILNHLKINDGREITREHHELFAKSFEKFLSLGKAPSVGMQDAFHSYKRWMEMIPGKIKELSGIELPDEIIDTFARMLASEKNIAEAEQIQEYAAIFSTPEDMGVSREVFDVYRKDAERAHMDGVDRETKRQLDHQRVTEQKWWNEERKKVLAEVIKEATEAKVYRALATLRDGKLPDGSTIRMAPFKLDRESLVKEYGQAFLKRLPGGTGKYGVYRTDGGVDIGVAAQALGYASAGQMIDAIRSAPKVAAWIRGETNARMQDRFPDPKLDGRLSDNALKAVHNNRRASVLATEMRALRARAREDAKIVRATKETLQRERSQARFANAASLPKKLELEQIKAGARAAIGKSAIRDVRPHVYLHAEKRAGRKAFEAAARGDYQQAYMFKRQQTINHEMYRAALKAKAANEATQSYLKKFDKTRVRQRLGKSGLIHKIDAILEGIDFRKRSLTEMDYQKYLLSIVGMIEDGELVVDADLAKQLQNAGTNWQELTVDQFAGIRDTVKQLEFMLKKMAEGVVNGEKALLAEAQDEIASSLYENHKHIDVGVGQASRGEGWKKGKDQAITTWLRSSSLARVLDRAGFGAITRRIMIPMRRAYAEKLIPGIHKAQKDMADIYLKHYTRTEMTLFQKKNRIEAMGQDLSKSDILSIALHWGSEGNRSALLGGVKRNGQLAYPEAGVQAALATLDARDWAFVQDTWDYLDTYWKDLSEAEQRRRGIAPQKVEALPFKIKTADGKEIIVAGGYMRLSYDRRHSNRVKANELEDLYKEMGNGVFISTSTRAGSTYERTRNHQYVVKLGLNQVDTHLREIIRDISIGDEVNFLKRVLNSSTVQNAFHETGNEVALDTLNLWLTDSAVGELPAEGIYEQGMSYIRTGFTKSKLAFNFVTMFLQFTGIFQTAAVIGTVPYLRGLAKFSQNPNKAWKHVMATSKFMEARYSIGAWDKDVADTKSHLESLFGPAPTRLKTGANIAGHFYFYPIMKAQQVVDVTTWLAAFDKGRNEENLSESDAVFYADSQVEAAQTSGFFSDRSGLERGTLGSRKVRQAQSIRIWTTLISYMLAKGNIAYEKTKATDFRKPSQFAKYMGDMILLFTVEGMASALLYGQLPDDDEPEDWGWWMAQKSVESVASGIPFVREVPAAMFGGGNTPLGSFATDVWDLGVQSSQLEADDAWRRVFINTLGTAGHLPASQTNRFIDVIWDEEDTEWYEWALGKRDK